MSAGRARIRVRDRERARGMSRVVGRDQGSAHCWRRTKSVEFDKKVQDKESSNEDDPEVAVTGRQLASIG